MREVISKLKVLKGLGIYGIRAELLEAGDLLFWQLSGSLLIALETGAGRILFCGVHTDHILALLFILDCSTAYIGLKVFDLVHNESLALEDFRYLILVLKVL